jgi:hypothetical protein
MEPRYAAPAGAGAAAAFSFVNPSIGSNANSFAALAAPPRR